MKLPWKTKSQLLQEEIEYLRSQVAQLQNYVLLSAPTAIAAMNTVPSQPSLPDEIVQRLHVSEEEADLDFQLQEGLIDADEWARRMDEIVTE